MKILMLTPYLPYPDSSGGQIRTQNLLKHLRKKHEITLFSLIKSKKEEQYIPILEKNFCKKVRVFYRPERPWMLKNILRTGFSLDPFLVVRNFSKEAKKAISQELRRGQYDLIHSETFYAMPHIPQTKLPVVLVDQTIEYLVYQHYVKETAPWFLRPLLQIDVEKLKYSERYYWKKATQVVAVSEADKKEMLKLEPNLDIEIVPNGVNLDLFRKKVKWDTKEKAVLQISNFKWLQNVEAALVLIKDVFPLVKKKVKTAKLWIVGQHVPDSILKHHSKDIIIKSVPEDDSKTLVDSWHDASVFASTIKGPGGTRLKNLASMASKLPIVSTSIGVKGLGVVDGTDVIIRDSSESLAEAIVDLLQNPKKAQSLAESAYAYVKSEYDYAVIAEKLSKIYQSLETKKNV